MAFAVRSSPGYEPVRIIPIRISDADTAKVDRSTSADLAETFRLDRSGSRLGRIPAQTVREDRAQPRVRLEDRLRAVAAVNRAIVEGGPSDDLLRLIAHRTRRLIDASLALVLLPQEPGRLAVRAADAADDELLRNYDHPEHAALAHTVMRTGEARLVSDLSTETSRRRDVGSTRLLGSALFVPVRVRAHVVAVLAVANERGARQLRDEELHAVRLFTAQIGLAVETHLYGRVRLLDALSLYARNSQVRAALDRLSPVPVEITNLLRHALDKLARTVVELADIDACSIQLLDHDLLLHAGGSSGLPDELLAALEAADRRGDARPALEAIAAERPVVLTNERERMLSDPALRSVHGLVHRLPWDAVGCVPLVTQSGSHGALCYYFAPERRPDETTLHLIKALATQAATVLDNARLLAAANKSVALEERQHLARELHDSVSQALYGIALGARATLEQLDVDPRQAREPVRYVLQLAETALAEMRAVIFELRPESLETEGLAAALVKQADAVRARNGIGVDVSIERVPDSAIDVHQVLYRIGQEALHNAAKHAAARHVELRLRSENGRLVLEVTDDGVGFDPEARFPGHLGLKSMRERAAAVGGTLEISSRPGTGTQVRATVPCYPAEGRRAR